MLELDRQFLPKFKHNTPSQSFLNFYNKCLKGTLMQI